MLAIGAAGAEPASGGPEQYIPAQPFLAETLRPAGEGARPDLALGVFYTSVAGKRYPDAPFMTTEALSDLYKRVTGEDFRGALDFLPEQSGAAIRIRWSPRGESVSGGDDKAPMAVIGASIDPAGDRKSGILFPVFGPEDEPLPFFRDDVQTTSSMQLNAGVRAVNRTRHYRLGEGGESFDGERLEFRRRLRPARSQGAVWELPLYLPGEAFALVSLDRPPLAPSLAEGIPAISGVSPQSIRRLESDDPEAPFLFLIFPGYDMPDIRQIVFSWGEPGSFEAPREPMRSQIENRYEVLGRELIWTTRRTYWWRDGSPVESVELALPTGVELVALRSDPVCAIGSPVDGRIAFTPEPTNQPVSQLRLEIVAVQGVVIDINRYPLAQDGTLCDSESLVFEQPRHVSLSHVKRQGLRFPRDDERIKDARASNVVSEQYMSSHNRPGFPVVEGFVRSLMPTVSYADTETTYTLETEGVDVVETYRFPDRGGDEESVLPNPLTIWLPPSLDEASLHLDWPQGASVDVPTTQTLAGNILTLEWTNAPTAEALTASYRCPAERLPAEASFRGLKLEAGDFLLPVSLIQGRTARTYSARIVADHRFRLEDFGDFFTYGSEPPSLRRTTPLVPGSATRAEVRSVFLGMLKRPPLPPRLRWVDASTSRAAIDPTPASPAPASASNPAPPSP